MKEAAWAGRGAVHAMGLCERWKNKASAASEVVWRLAADRAGGEAPHTPLWPLPGALWRGNYRSSAPAPACTARADPVSRARARWPPRAHVLVCTRPGGADASAASREMTKEDARDGTLKLIESIRIGVTFTLIRHRHLSRELCGQSCTPRHGAQLAGRVKGGLGNTVTVATLWAPALNTVPTAAAGWSGW